MKYFFFILIGFVSYVSKGQSIQSDTCSSIRKKVLSARLKGTENSYPLFFANDVIIRPQELNEKIIDTMYVLKCPDSFIKFQNLAGAGIVFIKTSQSFQTTTAKEIVDKLQTRTGNRKVRFAINGFLTENLDLKISTKAIKKLDVLLNATSSDKHISPDVAIVNIWTMTEKEKRRDSRLPKLCRGVGTLPPASN